VAKRRIKFLGKQKPKKAFGGCMFIIKDRVNRCTPDLIEMFKDVEPATVGHLLHDGFMDHNIKCLLKTAKIVGPAFTIRTAGADSTVVHKAMELAEKGDIIVVDRCGDMKHACWGGLVTTAAAIRGLAGAIIDGLATDVEEIERRGFPLFSKGISAITTKLLGFGGEINTVVQCGGVVVHPGDLIVADTNGGILVLDPDIAKPFAEKALSMQAKEKEIVSRLMAGEFLPRITAAESIIQEKIKQK
jgi:4-hydroxy-4-methyl-2-oxoglutarate aldolase